MDIKMTKYFKSPECHPNRSYYAKGLCRLCYNNQRYANIDPARKVEMLVKISDWRKANPENVRAARFKDGIKRKYGLSLAQFNTLLLIQCGSCAICGEVPESGEGNKGIHIDHDHATGEVRGLLCGRCNSALGLARDNVTTLSSMIDYLGGR